MRRFLLLTFAIVLPAARESAAQEAPTVTAREIGVAVDSDLSSDEEVIVARGEELILRAGRRAVPALAEGLRRRDPLRRRRCADLLGRIGGPTALQRLELALLDTGEDDALELSIASSLLLLGSKSGVTPLIDLLESQDRRIRVRALIALRRYTHQGLAFPYDGPARARAAAVRAWRAWWAASRETFALVPPPA